MTDDLDRINKDLSNLSPLIQEKVKAFSDALKKAHVGSGPTEEDRARLKALAIEASELSDQAAELVAAGEATLPPEVLAELLAEASVDYDPNSRIMREELNANTVPSSGRIEDFLEDALTNLMANVDEAWLVSEAEKPYGLDRSYREDAFSMVAGRRVVDTTLHRYAHALLVARDFLEGRVDYDFHLGALFVPELIALGTKLPVLSEVTGDANRRIASLYRGPTDEVESTIYELLVAASCALLGRDVEMIPAGQEKSPDIRIHDAVVPTVVECKRKRFLTEYEQKEEIHVRALFQTMYKTFVRQGIAGSVEVEFAVDVSDISPVDFAAAVQRIATFAENIEVDLEWGSVRFRSLPMDGHIQATRLYSPNYLSAVFGWICDMPEHDGIVCRVNPPESLITDRVIAPIGLKWRTVAPRALKVKARLVGDLLKSATDQIPIGEMGMIYLCYQEGARAEVANERTDALIKQIRDWWHRTGILIPAIQMQRLYPRALDEGLPDLIENVVCFVSDYADPDIMAATGLPSLVYSP